MKYNKKGLHTLFEKEANCEQKGGKIQKIKIK